MSEELIHQPVRGSGVWEHFTVRDGLPDMKLECLCEDRHGVLWIGTQDRGVARFDGDRFETFTTRDGLSGNYVSFILEDREGALWFGTDGGLTRLDGGRLEPVYPRGIEHWSFYRGCCVDREGRPWFGMGFRPGCPTTVCRWDGQHLEGIPLSDPEHSAGDVFCMTSDRRGDLWLIAPNTKLYRYDGERFHRMAGPSSPVGFCWALFARPDGSLWVAGSGGLFLYDEGQFLRWGAACFPTIYTIVGVLEDPLGGLWVVNSAGQVWRGDAIPSRRGSEPPCGDGPFWMIGDLDTVVTGNLCLDRLGRVWVGTIGKGLYCYDATRFEVFGKAQGLRSDQVNNLAEDEGGTLWVGTEKGMVGYDGSGFHPLEGTDPLADASVRSLWVDSRSRLWIGLWNGKLYVYEEGKLYPVMETTFLGSFSLTEDRGGRMWFAFSHFLGFAYYEHQAVRRFPPGRYPRFIGALLADRGGRLWVGLLRRGELRGYEVAALTGDCWEGRSSKTSGDIDGAPVVFTPADGLADGSVLALFEDREGDLWIGTSEGISWYDGTRFRTFTQADGLPQGMVTAITQTRDGTLWFGTEGGGVCCYDGQVFQTIQMPGDVGGNVVRALHSDREGRMWFGTLGGLVRYTRHGVRPEVTFTEVVADRTYAVEEDSPVEIPTTAGRVRFHFRGRSATQRASYLVYRYRLEGVEEDWHQTRDRQAEYPPLTPGEYTFCVQAVDMDLNYSEKAEVQVTVTPDPRIVGLTEALHSGGVSEEFVGKSKALHHVLTQIQEVARTDLTVLIAGETGTGKGLVARAVHGWSGRREGAFIPVSCGGIPEGLVESELFGHERGAFTGANSRKLGKVELAQGGTLFLDEIGDLAWPAQAKLLRLLEERTFERVGGMETLKADLRVIAATNRDLGQMVLEEQFREDLYFRLSAFPVRVPPLRERGEDIALLAAYFAARMAAHLNKPVVGLSPEAVSALQAYAWPGNVRELEHVVQRAVIVSQGSVIRPEEIELEFGGVPGVARPDVLSLAEHERQYIRRVLQRTGGKIHGPEGAAALLGVPESTLRSRIKRLGIVWR